MPKKWWPALLALLIVCLAAAPAPAAQRHRLPNGLTVITQENHEAPVVAIQVWVHAGSAYEEPHQRGITHLIEHMIFKGTPSRPAGQMARQIEALGGQINAYTSLDHTNYYVATASQNAGQALDILADAVVNAAFDQGELAREKEVVLEEIRMNQDDPGRRRSQALMAAAFGDHPYGRPVIGTAQSVRAISRQDILDYMAKWYRGPGMVVVAVGDFNTAELLPRIQRAFAAVPAQAPPRFEIPPVTGPQGPRLVLLREDVRQAAIEAAWLIPGLPSPEVYALDMAATVLGDGATSRLYQTLKYRDGLVDGVSCSAFTPQTMGLFGVEASLPPDKVQPAWPKLLEQACDLMAAPPKAAELERARVNLAAAFVRQRQTVDGQANTLGYFEMMRGGFEKAQTYLNEFNAVEADQVAEAARRWLRPENLTVVIQLPASAPAPQAAELTKAAQAIYARLAASAPQAAEAPRKVTLQNGLTVIVKPARAVPLVNMVLAGPGGQAAETPADAGRHQLWARCVTRGTAKHSFPELSAILEDMAADISGFAGKSSAGLSASFLAQDWRRGLDLLAETWLEPTFPPDEVQKAKAEQAAALRAQLDTPWMRAFDLFRPLLYGKHPYALNQLGSFKSLAGLTPEDLRRTQADLRGPGGLVLTIVGDVDPEAVMVAVNERFGRATGRARATATAPVPPLTKPRDLAEKDPQAKQTQIVMGFIAPDATDPRRFAMGLLEAILGGQGGRLFGDLRDKRSLAYAVQPFYTDAWRVGSFGFYMAVGPGKEQQALDGLEEHIARIVEQPPSDEELRRAKAYVLGSRAIALQTYAAQAMVMTMDELMGLGYLDYLKTPERIEAVSATDILRVAKEVFGPQRRALLTQGQ